ncbi:MAG: hypothetical protein L3K15_00585 [Thermoplasmata archaeon]|nr:hypothetical protein [Thermoplasmata archaeon]
MSRTDLAGVLRSVPSAVGLLLVPALALALVGQVPVAAAVVLPAVAAGAVVLFRWLNVRYPDVALLPPMVVLGILIGLAAPGPASELFALAVAVGILLWLAVATNPARKLPDLAAGVVVPAFGGGVALALSLVAPSGFAFVGAGATLAGFGFVVAAVIVWMLTRPGPSASA